MRSLPLYSQSFQLCSKALLDLPIYLSRIILNIQTLNLGFLICTPVTKIFDTLRMHMFVKHTSVHSINDIPKLSLRWDNVFLVNVPQSLPSISAYAVYAEQAVILPPPTHTTSVPDYAGGGAVL